MNTYAKLAIPAAAVVVVALVAINLLPRDGGTGGPDRTATPAPTVAPTTAVAIFPPAGELAIGSHRMSLEGLWFTFNVPTSGWVSNGSFGLDKVTGSVDYASLIFWNDVPLGVFSDPCATTRGPSLQPSLAALADAAASVPGTNVVSGPTDVTVDGHPAKQVVIDLPDELDCPAASFSLWYGSTPGLVRVATAPGSTISVWVIDVDGTTIWIEGETYRDGGRAPGQEVDAIVDSIQFE